MPELSKNTAYLAAVIVVALMVVGSLAIMQPVLLRSAPGQQAPRTLQVSGTGTVSASPDQATLTLAVVTQTPAAADAVSQNAAIMNKVLAALKDAGFPSDDLQTTTFSLQPIYDYAPDHSAPTLVGYQARHGLQVTTSDFGKIGIAIDAAVAAGANEVDGITFGFTRNTYAQLERTALQSAAMDAEGRAQTIASATSVKLGSPLAINPGVSYAPFVQTFADKTAGTTPIVPPSSLEVSATIQITYELV